jgi:hypothetical protein
MAGCTSNSLDYGSLASSDPPLATSPVATLRFALLSGWPNPTGFVYTSSEHEPSVDWIVSNGVFFSGADQLHVVVSNRLRSRGDACYPRADMVSDFGTDADLLESSASLDSGSDRSEAFATSAELESVNAIMWIVQQVPGQRSGSGVIAAPVMSGPVARPRHIVFAKSIDDLFREHPWISQRITSIERSFKDIDFFK